MEGESRVYDVIAKRSFFIRDFEWGVNHELTPETFQDLGWIVTKKGDLHCLQPPSSWTMAVDTDTFYSPALIITDPTRKVVFVVRGTFSRFTSDLMICRHRTIPSIGQ